MILAIENNILSKGRLTDKVLLLVSFFFLLVVWIVSRYEIYECFVLAYFTFTLLRFINNLGYTICFFDFLTFYSALDTLVSPWMAYRFFDRNHPLAALWGSYMRVPADVYFGYMIPANLALFTSLHLIFKKNSEFALTYLERAKSYVSDKLWVGVFFIVIGLIANLFLRMVPSDLTFIFYLLSMLPYVGGFYIYFSVKKRRGLIMILLVLVFFIQAIRTGMFGDFVMYMGLSGCIILSQYRLRFFSKLTVFLAGFFLILVIQSIKGEYRSIIWTRVRETNMQYLDKNDLEIFSGLISDRITDPEEIINEKSVFFMNKRFNQGFLISLAMNYVPQVEPFADGETIAMSVAAVVVPRFLWEDKPEAGGAYNLSRFVGIKRKLTYSMNIGPYGEGYGNFGIFGGIVFIFVYGLLIAFFLHKTLEKSKKYPSLIIWTPLLFYYVLTVETDIVTTINSFVKTIVFIYLIYWIFQKTRVNI
ncbi:MAG TPA: hypothetical protein VMI12_06085 [Puia sp.]|nr:hypothetical protein [Puia sp.]